MSGGLYKAPSGRELPTESGEGECVIWKQFLFPNPRGLLPSFSDENATVSLRLGHAAALTPHRGVIHYRVAASLPHEGGLYRLVSDTIDLYSIRGLSSFFECRDLALGGKPPTVRVEEL